MPLPSALAARLAKRGLINKSASSPEEKTDPEIIPTTNITAAEDIEEEVIAEDYDDQENQGSVLNKIPNKLVEYEDDEKDYKDPPTRFMGHPGCPNKYNIYHECTNFCRDFWKDGHKEPDPKYLKRKAAMLKKYPLPSHWKEIYDPGTGRHYYWETDSDSVSWLPPTHPKAVISESAAIIREEQQSTKDETDRKKVIEEKKSDYESSEESEEEIDRLEEKRRKRENLEKLRSRGRIKKRENDLDPMDPASYSDIPRGGWSDGLSKGNEAKTGADVTAAGPLFQMRPYPNPGAVLRANASIKPPPTQKVTVFKPEEPESP